LYADDEPGLGQTHRFNLTVRRNRFDAKRRSGAINPLRVQRIHHHFGCAGKRRQQPARAQNHTMRWAVRAIRRIFPRTMVETAGKLVHSLVQSATERDIQLLDTSADSQNRQITPNCFAN
jgi:hypothetical protein